MLTLKLGSNAYLPGSISLMTPDGRDLFDDLCVCGITVDVGTMAGRGLTRATLEIEIDGCEVEFDPRELKIKRVELPEHDFDKDEVIRG